MCVRNRKWWDTSCAIRIRRLRRRKERSGSSCFLLLAVRRVSESNWTERDSIYDRPLGSFFFSLGLAFSQPFTATSLFLFLSPLWLSSVYSHADRQQTRSNTFLASVSDRRLEKKNEKETRELAVGSARFWITVGQRGRLSRWKSRRDTENLIRTKVFFASSSLRHPRASSRATTKTHRCPHAMYLRIDVEKEKSGITRWSCGLQVLNQEQPNCVFAVAHKMPDGCRCGRTLRCESIIHIDWVGSCCIFHSFILRPHPAGRVVSALTTSLICPHIINICGNLLRWKMALKNATTDFLIPSRSFGIRLSALNFPSVRPVVCAFPPSSSRSISIRLLPYSSRPQKTERASIPQRH